jgi:hypothetical protein
MDAEPPAEDSQRELLQELRWYHYSEQDDLHQTGFGRPQNNAYLTNFDAQGNTPAIINRVLSVLSPQRGAHYLWQYSIDPTGLRNSGMIITLRGGVFEVEVFDFIEAWRIGNPARIPGR